MLADDSLPTTTVPKLAALSLSSAPAPASEASMADQCFGSSAHAADHHHGVARAVEDTPTAGFGVPARQIVTKEDLEAFQTSQACEDYVSFIVRLNDSVIGLPTTKDCFVSQVRLVSRFFAAGLGWSILMNGFC
jgi:hypothetical protein